MSGRPMALSKEPMEITIEVTPHPPFEGTTTYRALAWVGDQYSTTLYSQCALRNRNWCADEAAKKLSKMMRWQYPNATFKTKLANRVETRFPSLI